VTTPVPQHTLPELPEHLAGQIRASRTSLEGERKQVSVMFVDVVRSMELARMLDPERWRELIERFLAIATGAVRRYDGTLDKFTGDGVMAIFGAPVSQEDHARRACLAALSLDERLGPLARELRSQGIAFQVRVGINSGEVIVGEIGGESGMAYTAIGHTVGLAQRMQELAPEGGTALSAATASLLGAEFELCDLGVFEVKGSEDRERVLSLVGEQRTRSGGDGARAPVAAGAPSPFVGRERERSALEAALERALADDGQVVGLVGEPGVGKSRLAGEFCARCEADGIAVQRARALAHAREVPYLPMLELWRATLGIGEEEAPALARRRIEDTLDELDASFVEELPLIFDFLGLADPTRPTERMDPEARQRRLLAIVRRFVHARSRAYPAVTLVEDLHWLDPASSVFLGELVRAAAGTRTLLILTYRPDHRSDLLGGSHCEQLALRPLADGAVADLLRALLGGDPSLDGLSELIAARAVGNPFFCEELVQALSESGRLVGERGAYTLAQTLEGLVLPATVQATLAARIDRLGEREKQLVQVASVVGYEVSESILGEISSLTQAELQDALRALVAAELLGERMGEEGVSFAFKHPLTQEVAYRSQLGEARRRTHRQVADAIEQLHPERADELASLVASHREAAGESLLAARCYARAATWVGNSDISQALLHWQKAGELSESDLDAPEASSLALAAHVHRLDFGWRLGMSEQEAESHYRSGRELAIASGDQASLLLLTAVYANVRGTSGNIEQYAELGSEVDRLSREIGDPAQRMAVLSVPVFSLFLLGRVDQALAAMDEGIALGAGDPALGGGINLSCPYAFFLMMRGVVLTVTGQFEEAPEHLERALEVARAQGDLEIEGFTQMNFTWLARYLESAEGVLTRAGEGLRLAERFGSTFSRIWAQGWMGYAHLTQGNVGEAITALEGAIALARGARTGLEAEPFWLAGLSEALLAAGEHERALACARESLGVAAQRGAAVYLPGCHRALADALLAGSQPDDLAEAERELEQARAAVEQTGLRAELRFIERAQEHLASVR
jgi:adenylate cyclase